MVSDTASHFKNRVVKTLQGALRVEFRFAVDASDGLRLEDNFAGREGRYSRVGKRGASDPVGSEDCLSRDTQARRTTSCLGDRC